jgi:hypothetical protein
MLNSEPIACTNDNPSGYLQLDALLHKYDWLIGIASYQKLIFTNVVMHLLIELVKSY